MTIKTWAGFTKRKNSTARPSVGYVSRTVTLKEGTSIENPTFLLTGALFSIDYVEALSNY